MKHETIEGSYYGFAASVHVALAIAISSQRVVALGESMVRRMRQSAPVSASSRPRPRMPAVYSQINVYGVTTKSERHKRSYWTRTADGNGVGGRKAPVPYGS